MTNIIDIYEKYYIPEHLQLHMLRVAPDGVRGVKERLEEVKERYKNKPNSAWSEEKRANHLIECAMRN